MPWPMVHFAVSEQISGGVLTPELLIGSIAPDAIHARGQVTREEKGETHFVRNGRLPSPELILDKFQWYYFQEQGQQWQDFILGYFSHIYTDLRWTETLYTAFETRFTGEPSNLRNIYNEEVSQLEFDLLESFAGKRSLLANLKEAKGFPVEPFVTQQEVQTYRDEKCEWLHNSENKPGIVPFYFRKDLVTGFIASTAQEWTTLLSKMDLIRQH